LSKSEDDDIQTIPSRGQPSRSEEDDDDFDEGALAALLGDSGSDDDDGRLVTAGYRPPLSDGKRPTSPVLDLTDDDSPGPF
jgi:hypothetical protein